MSWGVGLNQVGGHVRYFFTNQWAIEAKAQTAGDVCVGGMRGYYYLSGRKKLRLLAGLEGAYISVDDDSVPSTGYAGALFFGCEQFFADKLSFQLDMGPAYVALKSNGSSLDVSGVEYVVNMAVNWYWGP